MRNSTTLMTKLMLCPLFLLLFLILGSMVSLFVQIDSGIISALIFDPEIHFALILSITTALVSLLFALIIAIPAAWSLERIPFKGKKWLNLILDLPMVMPPLVAGIGLLLLLGQAGPVNDIFPAFARWLFSPIGIVIAQTYVASAIIVRNSSAAFSSIDKGYLNAAYNLGLTPIKTLLFVEIPLVWKVLLSSCILALARAMGEFGATLMLAGATRMKTETLPMAIYLNIASGDFKQAIGCALLLMLIASSLLFIIHLLQREAKQHAVH